MEVTTTTVTDIRTSSAFSGGEVIAGSMDVGDYAPIVDHLMKQKFELYNQVRQKLTADIKRVVPLKPFTMFKNSKQADKPFFSIGYSYNVLDDLFNIELYEYDNETLVNLVED